MLWQHVNHEKYVEIDLIWIVVDVNDCLDLPSLTSIQCEKDCGGIHDCMGRVILESMIWFDLIWFYND